MSRDGRPGAAASTITITPRLVFGVAIMVVGVLFTLDNLGFIDAHDYLHFWPVALIAIGLVKLLQPTSQGGGWLWMLAGAGLLLDELGYLSVDKLWPLFLVLLGGYIAWRAAVPRKPRSAGDSSSLVSAFAVMGAAVKTNRSTDFTGGDLTAIMGGCEVDLRDARIESGEAVVDTFAFWGGIEIIVPEDWHVVSRGVALMGGFEDKTRGAPDSKQRLIVKGLAFMGGVEIKNKP